MGIKISNESKQEPAPPSTFPQPKSKDIFSKMTQKVLLSQEELYSCLTSRNCGSQTQRSLGVETDLYYAFLTNRQGPLTAKNQPNALSKVESMKALTTKNINLKYTKAAFVNSYNTNEPENHFAAMNRKTKKGAAKSRCSIRANPVVSRKTVGKIAKPVVKKSVLKVSRQEQFEDEFMDFEDPPLVQACRNTPRPTPFCKISLIPPKKIKAPYKRSIALRHLSNESLPQFDKVSLLPSNIFITILSYAIDSFKSLITVNPAWYHASISALDAHFNFIENSFINTYADYLLFKDSYTSSGVMKFCDMGAVRIDRVLKCENICTTIGKTLVISFTYKYCNEPLNEYKCEYMFDSVKQGSTCVWLHKNECEENIEDIIRASTQPVVPICEGDNLEITLPFYSLRGLVDLSSVKWLPPVLLQTPKENVMNYKRETRLAKESDKSVKLLADLSRICDLEDSQMEWRYVDNIEMALRKLKLGILQRYFEVKDMEYSYVDIYVAKLTLKAKAKGEVPYNYLGIAVKIREKYEDCTKEVKRVGLLIERHVDLELRIGDTLVVYVSKPGI